MTEFTICRTTGPLRRAISAVDLALFIMTGLTIFRRWTRTTGCVRWDSAARSVVFGPGTTFGPGVELIINGRRTGDAAGISFIGHDPFLEPTRFVTEPGIVDWLPGLTA